LVSTIVGKLAQEKQIRHPTHLLVGPVGLIKAGAQAPIHVARSGRHVTGEASHWMQLKPQLERAAAALGIDCGRWTPAHLEYE